MEVLDFELSSFVRSRSWDNTYQNKFNNNIQPYTAVLFKSGSDTLLVGVTYEVERAFRWLKHLTTASTQISVGALRIYNTTETHTPLTSKSTSLPGDETDDIILVAFETSTREIVIAQFGVFQGELVKAHKITKTFTDWA